MFIPKNPDWADEALYVIGWLTSTISAFFFIGGVVGCIQTCHRRYQKGKWIEQEPKGDADE